MKRFTSFRDRKRQRGQSLVETALVLPLMVILIAGVVEVSNIMITKNRIETAARAAARFAAQGGVQVEDVALNAVTDTLDLSSGVWNIWLVEGAMNDTGTDFDSWEADGDRSDTFLNTPIYGEISATIAYTDVVQIIGDCTRQPDPVDWSSAGANRCVKDQVLVELNTDVTGLDSPTSGQLADVRVVGVYISHDVPSILGLNAFPAFSGILSVSGFSVMRTTSESSEDATMGCLTAAPIGFDGGRRSITESEYNNLSFTYPATAPDYGTFHNNEDVPLSQAREGYVYVFRGGSLEYVWPKWNSGINSGSTTLANSLTFPGDTFDYDDHGDPGGAFTPPGYVVRGFVNVNDSLDRELSVGDWVSVNDSASIGDGTVQSILQNHIDSRRGLRVITLAEGGGAPQFHPDGRPYYEVEGFAVFRIVGYSVSDNWLLAEFINWDDSCGQ